MIVRRRLDLSPVLPLCCLLSLMSGPVRAIEPPAVMQLASLEWLPYVGPGLPQGGLSGAVAAAAARQFGYLVQIKYFPWKRAMQIGSGDAAFSGYFPAYYTEERAHQCYFSASMGQSVVGLAYLKSKPLKWHAVSDLAGMKIGVVDGYSNGSEFDALVKQGIIQIDPSPRDIFNLKKLLAGRVRAVVIDRAVLRYLLLTDPELSPQRGLIAFHENILAELSLHVCFQRTAAGHKMQQSFDTALHSLDLGKIENSYFKKLERAGKPGAK